MTANNHGPISSSSFDKDNFFKSSWDEFDRRREEMDKRSREWMEQGEREFRAMTGGWSADRGHGQANSSNDRTFGPARSEHSSHHKEVYNKQERRRYNNTDGKSNRSSSPDLSFFDLPSSRNRKVGFLDNEDNECMRQREDKDKLEVSFDTSQYKPDELKVTVSGGVITVEGNHEERSQAGEVMVSRRFERKFSLPAGARPEDVESNLSSGGVLVVTARKSLPSIQVKINKG